MAFSYRMFEPNLDEYLDEELDNVKRAFDTICKSWSKNVRLLPFMPSLEFPD